MATIPPLIAVCYVDPYVAAQNWQAQVPSIAKYPVIIIGSRNLTNDIIFKNTIKAANPRIKMLGYILANERTNQNNPAKSIFAAVPTGSPYECNYIDPNTGLTVFPQLGLFRLFDWRWTGFPQVLSNGVDAVLNTYPYDGIFFDNSGVFNIAQPDTVNGTTVALVNGQTPADIRADMQAGYQVAMSLIRSKHPGILMITNGTPNYVDTNGGMVEGHPERQAVELPPFAGQASPGMDVALTLDTGVTPMTDSAITTAFNTARAYGNNVFYAYTRTNYQLVTWPTAFDAIAAAYPPDPPATPPPIRIRIR
jgi:hypothetical protein